MNGILLLALVFLGIIGTIIGMEIAIRFRLPEKIYLLGYTHMYPTNKNIDKVDEIMTKKWRKICSLANNPYSRIEPNISLNLSKESKKFCHAQKIFYTLYPYYSHKATARI